MLYSFCIEINERTKIIATKSWCLAFRREWDRHLQHKNFSTESSLVKSREEPAILQFIIWLFIVFIFFFIFISLSWSPLHASGHSPVGPTNLDGPALVLTSHQCSQEVLMSDFGGSALCWFMHFAIHLIVGVVLATLTMVKFSPEQWYLTRGP